MIKNLLIAYVAAVKISMTEEPLPDFNGIATQYVGEHDKNQDGGLDRSELEDRYKPFFKDGDANGDKKVDAAEIAAWLEANQWVFDPTATGPALAQVESVDFNAIAAAFVKAHNTDGVDGLSLDEMAPEFRKYFATGDADANGVASVEEIAAWIENNQWVLKAQA